MTLLFVDDEVEILDLYIDEIKYYFPNYEVFVSSSGPEALKICQENQINHVFTDGRMPQMNGYTLAKRLTESQFDGRIFMITGHQEDINGQELKDIGVDRVFYKPLNFNLFVEFIRKITQF